jgi:hypothetical protein
MASGRLFSCVADCDKSRGTVHLLFGRTAVWSTPVRTVPLRGCSHTVCIECVASRPQLLRRCPVCTPHQTRQPRRKGGSAGSGAATAAAAAGSSVSPSAPKKQRTAPATAMVSGNSAAAAGFFRGSAAAAPAADVDGDSSLAGFTEYEFDEGDCCLVADDTYVTYDTHESFFEVRVVKRRRQGDDGMGRAEYRVHFLGWKARSVGTTHASA